MILVSPRSSPAILALIAIQVMAQPPGWYSLNRARR